MDSILGLLSNAVVAFRKNGRSLFLVGLTAAAFYPQLAKACASCGSGGDSPLILYPNETWKVYAGVTSQSGFETIDPEGRAGKDNGPERRETLTFAAGRGFGPDGFMTLVVPYIKQSRDDRSKSGAGDPMLSATWTALPATLAAPWQPQVQLTAARRQATSLSLQESEDLNWLDVFGSGFNENRAGVDIWMGQTSLKAGAAQVFSFPEARHINGAKRAPGRGSLTTVTLGYGPSSLEWKIVAGVTRDQRGKRKLKDNDIADSEIVSNNVFSSIDGMISPHTTLRLTLTRASAFGENRNSSRNHAITLAAMGSW